MAGFNFFKYFLGLSQKVALKSGCVCEQLQDHCKPKLLNLLPPPTSPTFSWQDINVYEAMIQKSKALEKTCGGILQRREKMESQQTRMSSQQSVKVS